MENELLKALFAYKQNLDPVLLQRYLGSFTNQPVTKGNADLLADIENLLLRQREFCAEEVPLSYTLNELLKDNILNAKIF